MSTQTFNTLRAYLSRMHQLQAFSPSPYNIYLTSKKKINVAVYLLFQNLPPFLYQHFETVELLEELDQPKYKTVFGSYV